MSDAAKGPKVWAALARKMGIQALRMNLNTDDNVPQKIKTALHKAAEIACGNVPELPGPVVIGLDTSGSMSCAVTGNRVQRDQCVPGG